MKKLGVVAAAAAVLALSGPASAGTEVSGTAKGIIGCGLIAGELTLTIEAAAGVDNPWLLSIIPIVVAGGGAAGGYFLEQASPEGAVATFAIGTTLLVPSILLALVLTADTYEDQPATTPQGESTGGGATPAPTTAVLSLPAFVNLAPGGANLSVPTVVMGEGPKQSLWNAAPSSGLEYHLSLFRWAF